MAKSLWLLGPLLAMVQLALLSQGPFRPPPGGIPATTLEKGVGFTLGRAAVIDTKGKIGGATGTLSNCIKVDGTSGTCGGSSATPGGSNTQCQFNDSGAFGGDVKCTFDKATGLLTVTGITTGDGTKSQVLALAELVANGTSYSALFAKGSLSSTMRMCLPDGDGSAAAPVMVDSGSTAAVDLPEGGTGTCRVMVWSKITEAMISLIDVTTNDVSTANHGFAPKLPNDATKFLNGVGGYAVPAGGGGSPVSGLFWPLGIGLEKGASNLAPASGSANVTQFYQFYLPSPGVIVNTYTVFPNAATPGHVAAAVYDSTCTLVAGSTSATVSATASTVTDLSVSALSLAGGAYFLALTSDASTTRYYGVSPSYVSEFANSGEGPTTYRIFTGSASTGTTTLTFPSTCGTRTALSVGGGTGSYPGLLFH